MCFTEPAQMSDQHHDVSTRTTQLYDRRRDEVSFDEVDRIEI
jgi:hypothetical protein